MQIVEFGPMTDAFRAQLEGEERDPFGTPLGELAFRPKDRHVGLRDETGLIASTGLVLAEAEVAGARFGVVGIGGVIVRAAYRGRGLARTVVEIALERACDLGPDFALLFCLPDRRGLYERLAFSELDDEVRVAQPDGWSTMSMHAMWRALHDGATWPPGPLKLHSLPF